MPDGAQPVVVDSLVGFGFDNQIIALAHGDDNLGSLSIRIKHTTISSSGKKERKKNLPTHVIRLIGNKRYQIVSNDSKGVVVNRKSEMALHSRVHDSDAVLGTCLEDGLIPRSAIAISIRAIDESVLKGGRESGRLHSIPERRH